MKAFRGLSQGVKWRICNRVLSDGIDPETVANEFGLDVVVVKDVIMERETGKVPSYTAYTSAFVEKTQQQGSSSQSQSESAANPNQLMQEIHEKIESTDRDYSKRILFFSRDAKSSAASSSSSLPSMASSASVRPLPIAALMGDVNPIAVSETDTQEGNDDEDGGEHVSKNFVQRGTKRYVNFAKQDPGKVRQSGYARARTKFSQPRTSLFVSLCTVK